ncbi:hypothetical protein DMH04_49835 [Kibdelosporangium aridum]|uniref:DUF2079 domain-containing protein n=1 Tax=Kibdelosporangium aridum TaxID=2030 RepID=A0A428YC16_KIBAR|nr:hypothetical protein [Kibdelosporangium aridum]RSM65163.1 hypothetical protein DMH04_49835 [Kibdelosporangium aridum]
MTATATRPAPALVLPKTVSIAAAVVAAIPFVIHAIATFSGYFGQDDFVILYRAGNSGPFDPGYLFQDYSGHIAPGMFLLAWFITAPAPLNYTIAVIPALLMQAGASILLWRLLVRVFGHRWGLLLPYAMYTFSSLILYSTMWWAYAVQLFPLLLTMFGAFNTHLTYLRTREPKHVVTTLLWTVAGMAFYEKAALFLPLLFGFTLLLGERAPWRVWLAHGALLAGFVALYAGLTASRIKEGLPSGDVIAEFLRRSVVDVFLPGLFGGPWTDPAMGAAISTPPLGLRIAAAAVAVAVIAGGILVGGRKAVLAWSLLGAYVVVDLALVIITRLPEIGPLIGNDPRYTADAVPITVLCGAFAYSSLRLKRPAAGVMVVLLGVSATLSYLWLAPGLKFEKAKQYVATAQAALKADPSIVLYDTPVHEEIMNKWFFVDGKASRVIGLLPGPPKFDQPTENMYMLDDNGSPRKINNVRDPVVGRPGPYAKCGYAVGYNTATIPLSGRVDGRRLLRMEYYTSGKGPVTMRLGKATHEIHLNDGLHVLYLVVDGSFDRVDINRATQVDPMCVVDVRIGTPVT